VERKSNDGFGASALFHATRARSASYTLSCHHGAGSKPQISSTRRRGVRYLLFKTLRHLMFFKLKVSTL
jgi:hypothetical protein